MWSRSALFKSRNGLPGPPVGEGSFSGMRGGRRDYLGDPMRPLGLFGRWGARDIFLGEGFRSFWVAYSDRKTRTISLLLSRSKRE